MSTYSAKSFDLPATGHPGNPKEFVVMLAGHLTDDKAKVCYELCLIALPSRHAHSLVVGRIIYRVFSFFVVGRKTSAIIRESARTVV